MNELEARDRAFARLLVTTVLRRLGQIDALIAHCLERPLPARATATQDLLRLGLAQLLFLRTPPHAAVATSVELADTRGFLSHKGLVNAVLRRLSQEAAALMAVQDEVAPQRAAMAVAELVRGLWREDGARHRPGAFARAAARHHDARRSGAVARAARCDSVAERIAAAPGRRADRRAARLCRWRVVGAGCGGGVAGEALRRHCRRDRARSVRRARRQDRAARRRGRACRRARPVAAPDRAARPQSRAG